jgi:hypothetical protein
MTQSTGSREEEHILFLSQRSPTRSIVVYYGLPRPTSVTLLRRTANG